MATETRPVKKATSIFEEIEKINDQITRRAYEIFEGNGGFFGNDLADWLAAERELLWKPPLELREKDDQYLVNIAVPGVEPKDLEIRITPEDLLVKGETHHEHSEDKGKVHTCEFQSGSLFRAFRFPKKINPDDVKAEFKNGMLYLTAPVAEEQRARTVKIGVA